MLQSVHFLCNFNSIKVRLEPAAGSAAGSAAGFQFHKGAIRTPSFIMMILENIYFNSIKVRLERLRLLILMCLFVNFNSIKVRLELIKFSFSV